MTFSIVALHPLPTFTKTYLTLYQDAISISSTRSPSWLIIYLPHGATTTPPCTLPSTLQDVESVSQRGDTRTQTENTRDNALLTTRHADNGSEFHPPFACLRACVFIPLNLALITYAILDNTTPEAEMVVSMGWIGFGLMLNTPAA